MSPIIIHNARILSFHPGFEPGSADAMAVSEGRITAIGRWPDLQSLATPETQLIDAGGKTVMPGLHDSHIHVWKVGNLKTYMLDVRSCESLDDLLSRLGQYARKYPDIAWVTARGFNEAAWASGQMPTRKDLDAVVSDRPVYLIRTCAHIAVCNTLALERCGIGARTVVPEGGLIDPDAGILSETALGLVTAHIPPYTKEELKTMVRAARDSFYSYGITAATDPAVDPLLLEAYAEMDRAGDLGFRLQAIPILLPDGGQQAYPIPERYATPYMSVNTVKFFSDGGLSGKTAALKRAYKGTVADHGVLRLSPALYLSLCRAAQEKGLGIATHAIGDAAIAFVIGVYRQLRGGALRIEHLGLPEEKHLRAMAELGISTSMQTIFISELGKNFIKYLDEAYLLHCYPVRSVLQHGILMALSSDAPVVSDINPFKGMEAAITRKSNEGRLIGASEGIGIASALAAYTDSAARISGLSSLGALKTGNEADFILLDRDPLSTPPAQLTAIQVLKTFIGGKCVWDNATL
jgi:predicted amidohydrolase YtcJ